MRIRALAVVAVGAFAALSCRGPGEPPSLATVIVRTHGRVDPLAVSWSPPGAVVRARAWSDGAVELTVDATRTAPIEVRVPEACPVRAAVPPAGETSRVEAVPLLDVGEDRPQAGFDADVEVRLVAGCEQSARGRVEWRQIEGAALPSLRVEERGLHVVAHTAPLAGVDRLPIGIVPFSPRTRAEAVLEATWIGDGGPVRRVVRIASAARATGVPSVAVGQYVVLGGRGWHVAERPSGARAEVTERAGLWSFAADGAGRWTLTDDAGHNVALRAGSYDRTPLDCGRNECHAAATSGAASSKMTHALETRLRTGIAECAIACHAVGEPGLRDGGFVDVARALSLAWPAVVPSTWDDLPSQLRRLGGVGCTACHGPAAIPEPDARWSVLRADVCATCHDAPPRYAHVAAWRASRMSRADADDRARDLPACARCHTTAGFLAWIGARPAIARAPAIAGPIGIACAACHAPHGAHVDRALVRVVAVPDEVGGAAVAKEHAASAICIACHAPAKADGLPQASAAALWLGRSGRVEDPPGPAPHAKIECLGCHLGDADPGVRGAAHTFRSGTRGCEPCHEAGTTSERLIGGRSVRDRALALSARLSLEVREGSSQPVHAAATKPASADARAAYDVALVLEDPAAWVHNAPFARDLLDEAERLASVRER